MSDSCDPMDYTPPDSSVHGIPQARLEWVAISFSRGSSPLRDPIQVSWIAGDLLHRKQILYGLSHQGSPSNISGGLFFCHLPASAGDVRNMGSIPGLGRFPGEGNRYPVQYSCLENPMTEEPGGLQSRGLQRVGHN